MFAALVVAEVELEAVGVFVVLVAVCEACVQYESILSTMCQLTIIKEVVAEDVRESVPDELMVEDAVDELNAEGEVVMEEEVSLLVEIAGDVLLAVEGTELLVEVENPLDFEELDPAAAICLAPHTPLLVLAATRVCFK